MTLTELQELIAIEVARLGGELLAIIPTEETLEQFLGVAAWRHPAKNEGVTHIYSVRKHAAQPAAILLQGHYTDQAADNPFLIVADAAARFFDETPLTLKPSQREVNRTVSRATPAQLQTALRRVEVPT